MKLRALVVASIVLLAGCGGGGGSAPVPHPTAQPTNTPTGGYLQTASLKLVIPLPRSSSSTKRNPQYVPSSAATLDVTVNSVNSGPPPSWVTPATQTVTLNGSICTPSGNVETCTISTIPAPPGTVNYTFTVNDASSQALSTLTTNENVIQGQTNSFSVTLLGIVKTVAVTTATLVADTPPSGNSQVVNVSAEDADGNVITGTYNNPFTLTDNDGTGVTSLAVNGTTASPVTVSKDTDAVTLAYNGQAVNNFTITAGGSGISGSGSVTANVRDVVFTGTTLDSAAVGGTSSDSNWGQQTVFFSQASGSQTISASELGWTDAPYSQSFTVDASGCAGKATVTPASGTSFTVTAVAVGVCAVKLNESGTGYPLTNHTADASGSATHDGKFWVSVTTSGFTVN